MKIGICATHLENYRLPKEQLYIGVDHGVEELLKQGIQPIFAIGDFDSLEDQNTLENLKLQVLPTRKDVTDTHAAIDYAISHGYDDIALYGVTGGRLDHFFAVICLLEKYRDIKITIYDQQNSIELLKPGVHHVFQDEYTYISFFAFQETKLSLKQTKYLLDDYLLKRDDPLCVSNEIDGNYAIVENSNDIFLVKSKDKN